MHASHVPLELGRPAEMALLLGQLIEISDTRFGRRHRRHLARLARHLAELYAARGSHRAEVFRRRLDQRLRNRQLAPVTWGEASHGRG